MQSKSLMFRFDKNSKVLKNLFFSACLLLVTYFCTFAIYNFDIFWHLANGRAMSELGQIVDTEIFSYTKHGVQFNNHAWLAQIVFYKIFKTFGGGGLLVFRLFIVASILYLLVLAAVNKGVGWYLSCLVASVACVAGSHRFMVRPELFSLFGSALLVYLLSRVDRNLDARRSFLLFVPLGLWLWNCLHGAIIGFLIIGSNALGTLLILKIDKLKQYFLKEGPQNIDSVKYAWIGLGSALTLILLTPHGMSYVDLFKALTTNRIIYYTSEFLPTSFNELFWPFWVLFIVECTLVAFALMRRVILFKDFVLFVAMAVLAVRYSRATTFFLLVTTPVFALLIQQLIKDAATNIFVRRVYAGLGSILLIVVLFFGLNVKLNYPPMRFAWGVNETATSSYPVGIARFLHENPISGNLYNSDRFGGYLSYYLPRDSKIFFYNLPAVFGEMYQSVHSKKVIEDWDINYAIVGHAIETKYIFTPDSWAPIFWEPNAILLVRKSEKNKALIEKFQLRYFNPEMSSEQFNQLLSVPQISLVLLNEMASYLEFRKDRKIAEIFSRAIVSVRSLPSSLRVQLLQKARKYNKEDLESVML